IFGFETRWEKQVCDPHCGTLTDVGVSSASVNRKMCFCFSLTALLDKLGVKDWATDKMKPALKSRLKKYFERNGGLKGPALSSNLLAWADDLILKARTKIDGIDVMLRNKHVPNSIAEWLEDQIEDPFGRLMEAWKSDLAEQLYKGEYTDLTAGAATDKIMGDLFDKVFNLARICDSGAFLFGDDFPGFLTLWKPVVTAYVTQDGEIKFSRDDEYKHPALKIVKL
ncbi:MAG: hypothetical protein QOH90_1597, partial [Actinomycetota bacterium]|nr:hypothetical protein [Actinomycetota bacterium]